MFSLRYGKRPVVEESQKISAGVCVRNFLFESKNKYNLNKETDVKTLIADMEAGMNINLKQDNHGEFSCSEPNNIKLTYSKSNLGKGYVFWFICNICGRRVKYLYFPPNSTILACRTCHRLTYGQQNESKKIQTLQKVV